MLETKMYAEAHAAFKTAIRLKPNLKDIRLDMAAALGGLGKTSKALQHIDAAIAQDPKYAYAHISKGAALLDAGQPEKALKSLDRAIRLDPDNKAARKKRNAALGHLGKSGSVRSRIFRRKSSA